MPRIHVGSFTIPPEAIDENVHVNNKEYLRWMEDAAIAHSAAQGWPAERYRAAGTAWYVRSHSISYLRPASAGMRLTVATWVATMGARDSVRRYAFLRTDDRKLVALAETLWTFVDAASGRATAIPREVREAFAVVDARDPELAAIAPLAFRGRRAGLPPRPP